MGLFMRFSHESSTTVYTIYKFADLTGQIWPTNQFYSRINWFGGPVLSYGKCSKFFKGTTSSCILQKSGKLFKIVISNPSQSSSSSATLVPFCFRITRLVFFFFKKPLFSGFPTLSPSFRPSKNDLKYRDVAALSGILTGIIIILIIIIIVIIIIIIIKKNDPVSLL